MFYVEDVPSGSVIVSVAGPFNLGVAGGFDGRCTDGRIWRHGTKASLRTVLR